MARDAVIVEAVRTPLGKRNGKLKDWHPVDLLAEVLNETIARSGVDAGKVDDVICGCVSQVGDQSLNIGRNAWLAAGLPEEVPATTVDRQCGSSQQAAHFAAQGRHLRLLRHRDRLWCREHDPRPDGFEHRCERRVPVQ